MTTRDPCLIAFTILFQASWLLTVASLCVTKFIWIHYFVSRLSYNIDLWLKCIWVSIESLLNSVSSSRWFIPIVTSAAITEFIARKPSSKAITIKFEAFAFLAVTSNSSWWSFTWIHLERVYFHLLIWRAFWFIRFSYNLLRNFWCFKLLRSLFLDLKTRFWLFNNHWNLNHVTWFISLWRLLNRSWEGIIIESLLSNLHCLLISIKIVKGNIDIHGLFLKTVGTLVNLFLDFFELSLVHVRAFVLSINEGRSILKLQIIHIVSTWSWTEPK